MTLLSTRSVPLVLAAAVVLVIGAGPVTAEPFGPVPPENRFLGPTGTATMHGDAESTDTTPLSGPGTGAVDIRHTVLAAA